MVTHKSSLLTTVPQTLEKRLEIMQAIRAIVAQDGEALQRRREEIAAIRHDFDALRYDWGLIEKAVRQACRKWALQELEKYSPDQPRVPAGQPGGRTVDERRRKRGAICR
jgi:hypothetical protein